MRSNDAGLARRFCAVWAPVVRSDGVPGERLLKQFRERGGDRGAGSFGPESLLPARIAPMKTISVSFPEHLNTGWGHFQLRRKSAVALFCV